MADWAHNYTDLQLEALERRFQTVYAQAEKEVAQKLENHLKKFEQKDILKQKLLSGGKITEEEYKKWRYGQMMTGKRWKELRERLAQDYTNANQQALEAVRHRMPDVYAENANYATYEIENGLNIDTSFTIYNRQAVDRILRDNPDLVKMPNLDKVKDLRWNRQHIQSAITQGVLQGESIPKIAQRLGYVTKSERSAATRTARTAMTSAQNAGRVESFKRAQAMGIKIKQRWLATMDGRVRHSHAVLDGEIRPIGERFSNGCMEPGDPTGPAEEVWNCRCRLQGVIEGLEDDISQDRFSRLDDMTYDEWKEYHRQKLEEARQRRGRKDHG